MAVVKEAGLKGSAGNCSLSEAKRTRRRHRANGGNDPERSSLREDLLQCTGRNIRANDNLWRDMVSAIAESPQAPLNVPDSSGPP